MKKRAEIIIQPNEFPAFLLGMKVRLGIESIDQFAAEIGISSNLLYKLLSGDRLPSKSLLQRFGMRVVYSFSQERVSNPPLRQRIVKKGKPIPEPKK
jgi:hypothetical protein